MLIVLFFIGLLFHMPAFAKGEEITVWDQKCVATEVRACLAAVLGNTPVCKEGELQTTGNCKAVMPYFDYLKDKPGNLQEAIPLCEKIVNYSTAPAKCSRTLNIPSAAQLDTFNNNFNMNFIRALEKAFPAKTAESAAPPTPASTPAPTKP